MKAQVIQLTDTPKTIEFLYEVIELLEKRKISDFVFAYRLNDEERKIVFNWWGDDTCLIQMGLIEYMKFQINEYMRGYTED